MKKYYKNKITKYEAFSFIEMLITLLIVSMVLLVTSATLSALIKASAISAAKTLSRSESEFVLEILEKAIKNSQSDQIFLYQSTGVLQGDGVINNDGGDAPVLVALDGGTVANEIHYRPVRSDKWVCIGFFEDAEGVGYIIKGHSDTQRTDCLLSGQIIILNSDEVDIEEFTMLGYTTSGGNYSFIIDLVLQPVHWIPGPNSRFKPEYRRQLLVTTEKLTY